MVHLESPSRLFALGAIAALLSACSAYDCSRVTGDPALRIGRLSGGEGPRINISEVYSDGYLRFQQLGRRSYCRSIPKEEARQLVTLVGQADLRALSEAAPGFDTPEARLEWNELRVRVPLEPPPAELLPLFRHVDAVFERRFGPRYDLRLVSDEVSVESGYAGGLRATNAGRKEEAGPPADPSGLWVHVNGEWQEAPPEVGYAESSAWARVLRLYPNGEMSMVAVLLRRNKRGTALSPGDGYIVYRGWWRREKGGIVVRYVKAEETIPSGDPPFSRFLEAELSVEGEKLRLDDLVYERADHLEISSDNYDEFAPRVSSTERPNASAEGPEAPASAAPPP